MPTAARRAAGHHTGHGRGNPTGYSAIQLTTTGGVTTHRTAVTTWPDGTGANPGPTNNPDTAGWGGPQ